MAMILFFVTYRELALNSMKIFQGAYLVKEIYKRYPFKIIIAYTGSRYDPRYNEYLNMQNIILLKMQVRKNG